MRISDWSSDVCSSDLSRSAASATDSPWRPCTVWRRTHRANPSCAGGLRTSPGAATARYGTIPHPSHRLHTGAHYVHIWGGRSEEHTSELQSLMRISYSVFFLKKTKR